ncbi:hypothetical protein D1007_58159 [Hordeum vulgare]|nr:hypothetical protein D1007_58159 [Hordeum vulgare]
MGAHTAPRHATSGHDESLSVRKNELGFVRLRIIGVKDLLALWKVLVDDGDADKVNLAIKTRFEGRDEHPDSHGGIENDEHLAYAASPHDVLAEKV